MKDALPQPVLDLPAAETQLHQLPRRDDAMLPSRQDSHRHVARFTFTTHTVAKVKSEEISPPGGLQQVL
jgi:hypothetical protein